MPGADLGGGGVLVNLHTVDVISLARRLDVPRDVRLFPVGLTGLDLELLDDQRPDSPEQHGTKDQQAEPDRAHYQRDLSVSYKRVGDLYRDLGQGEQARDSFLKSLRKSGQVQTNTAALEQVTGG